MLRRTRTSRLAPRRTVDGPHGPMRISQDAWPSVATRVDGPAIPTVTVVPGRGIAVDGQRVPAVNGTGSRWDPRRKARTCVVEAGGHRYELRPTGLCHARLTRDAMLIAEARDTLLSYFTFRVHRGIDARLTWMPGVTPLDAALGQAMVLVFGAGAPGLLTAIAGFWLDWLGY